MEVFLSFLLEIIYYLGIFLFEIAVEAKIAMPIQKKIVNSRFKKILFQEDDSYFIFILKAISLSIIFLTPFVITIIVLNNFG
jgi:hypothetical protein